MQVINSSSLTSLFPPLAMLLRLKTEPVMLPRNRKSIKNTDLSQEESCSGLSLLSEETRWILVISDWGGKWERSFEKGETTNKQTKNKMTLRIKYFYIFFCRLMGSGRNLPAGRHFLWTGQEVPEKDGVTHWNHTHLVGSEAHLSNGLRVTDEYLQHTRTQFFQLLDAFLSSCTCCSWDK